MGDRNPRRPLPPTRNQFRPLSDHLGYINDRVICPYNSNHQMKYHKLMRHLVKCEKQLKTEENLGQGETSTPSGYERCPFDSLHRFRSEERDNHFRDCKARAAEIYQRIQAGENVDDIDERYGFKTSPPPPNDKTLIHCT